MGSKKKARKGNHHNNGTKHKSNGYTVPLNEDGLVPNGFTISFDDFNDEVDIHDDSDDAREDAPRGGTGSQVLPVALHLADDFAGEPEDGDEYLFLVRQVIFRA